MNYLEQLEKIVSLFKDELVAIRANRPTPKLVEDIKVDYMGQSLPLKQVASISIVPPREIQVSVWDKNNIDNVVKAIEQSNVGINPSVGGNLIRINLPPLSQERRQELVKLVGQISENYRIRIRSLRDDYNKQIKNSEGGEDERFEQQEQLQKSVDESNEKIKELLKNKIKEIEE